MPRKKMSDKERLEVSNRMKKYWSQRRAEGGDTPAKAPRKRKASKEGNGKESLAPADFRELKKQTLRAARFIESCGTPERAKEVFRLVMDVSEKIS
jgi:hypothetical protein